VLLSYASKAKRELPGGQFVVEDPPEQLGKEGDFLGQHLLTPRPGVAVQVNAFDFPVWGPLEKLAPAIIAGVPDGALQLVSGSAGDLLARSVRFNAEADSLNMSVLDDDAFPESTGHGSPLPVLVHGGPGRTAHGDPRRHRALRRVHRGHLLRPHRRGSSAMTVTLTCKQLSPRPGDYGEVRRDAEVTNTGGAVVATYDVLTLVAKEWNE
jgi:hypothetical protein